MVYHQEAIISQYSVPYLHR